jgi:hypothetical protein
MTSPPVITIKCRAPEQRLVCSNCYVSKRSEYTGLCFHWKKGEIQQIKSHKDVHTKCLDRKLKCVTRFLRLKRVMLKFSLIH